MASAAPVWPIPPASPSPPTRALCRALIPEIGAENISVHFHDTRGMGLANAYAAMEEGISRFESSLGAKRPELNPLNKAAFERGLTIGRAAAN